MAEIKRLQTERVLMCSLNHYSGTKLLTANPSDMPHVNGRPLVQFLAFTQYDDGVIFRQRLRRENYECNCMLSVIGSARKMHLPRNILENTHPSCFDSDSVTRLRHWILVCHGFFWGEKRSHKNSPRQITTWLDQNISVNAWRAAKYPHIPCTPPPGGVEAEQR